MKRLLVIVSSMNKGGAETFLMKIYRNFNREQYQMDFCIMSEKISAYEEEIKNLGAKVYHITEKTVSLTKCMRQIKNIVKENQYKHVLRVNQHSLSVLDLLAAKSGGAKVLAMRSSNADSGSGISRILHKMFIFLPKVVPNVRFAPSTEAAEYTFGKNCIKNGKACLLHNAVDINEYKYSEAKRKKIRNEFDLGNKFVVGHIGRFNHQKNHMFLLEIFAEYLKINPNSVLMLVGTGNLKDNILDKADLLGIRDKIILTGVRGDVPALLSAMDIQVFPSFYEGMPNTIIEAQCASLPCIISDTITKEADITGLVKYMSLDMSASEWAKEIEIKHEQNFARTDMSDCFIKNKYDIDSVTKEFEKLIFA